MRKILKALKKLNGDNSGVTLVELIVAVVVLSISIGPLLYTFVFSTRFNAESKIRQKSTVAAQTVMESFKADSVTDICEKFKAAELDPSIPDKFLKNNTANYKFEHKEGSNPEIGKYIITNMTLADAVTGQVGRYDAVIDVTEALTTTEMPEVPVFDPRQDGLWEESYEGLGATYYDPYYVATTAVKSKVVDAGYDPANIARVEIERRIKIYFDDSIVTVEYEFPFIITMNDTSIKTGTVSYLAKAATKDGVNLSMPLRNIYFYYYPAYKDSYVSSTVVDVKQDILICTNATGREIDLYIYKQLSTTRTSYDLSACENTYKLYCASEGSSGVTNLYDSIQSNLAAFTPGGSVSGVPTMLIPYTGYGDGNIDIKDTIGSVKSGVLSYNISVNIYNVGDRSDVLSKMSGTVLK